MPLQTRSSWLYTLLFLVVDRCLRRPSFAGFGAERVKKMELLAVAGMACGLVARLGPEIRRLGLSQHNAAHATRGNSFCVCNFRNAHARVDRGPRCTRTRNAKRGTQRATGACLLLANQPTTTTTPNDQRPATSDQTMSSTRSSPASRTRSQVVHRAPSVEVIPSSETEDDYDDDDSINSHDSEEPIRLLGHPLRTTLPGCLGFNHKHSMGFESESESGPSHRIARSVAPSEAPSA